MIYSKTTWKSFPSTVGHLAKHKWVKFACCFLISFYSRCQTLLLSLVIQKSSSTFWPFLTLNVTSLIRLGMKFRTRTGYKNISDTPCHVITMLAHRDSGIPAFFLFLWNTKQFSHLRGLFILPRRSFPSLPGSCLTYQFLLVCYITSSKGPSLLNLV